MASHASSADATMQDVDDARSQRTGTGGTAGGRSDNDEGGSGDDGGSGSEEEDDSSGEESIPQPKILPKRTTRGTRLTTTAHGEGDDEFWEQEFFADEAEADNDYERNDAEEDEEPDEVDSDFDEDEDVEDDGEVEVDKEKKGKKSGAYVDPRNLAAKRAAAAKKAVATKAARKAAAAVASSPSTSGSVASGPIDTGAVKPVTVSYDEDGFPTGQEPTAARRRTTAPSDQSLAAMAAGRKSVRKATMENTMETSKKVVEHAKKAREAKPKAKVVFRLLTQEEQLAQSVDTEKENAASLAQLLMIEEEKKKVLAPKAKQLGDRILVKSTKQGQLVAFTSEVPEFLQPELPMSQ